MSPQAVFKLQRKNIVLKMPMSQPGVKKEDLMRNWVPGAGLVLG
jgi:hypothetical protein